MRAHFEKPFSYASGHVGRLLNFLSSLGPVQSQANKSIYIKINAGE